jgi:hypothetical protein
MVEVVQAHIDVVPDPEAKLRQERIVNRVGEQHRPFNVGHRPLYGPREQTQQGGAATDDDLQARVGGKEVLQGLKPWFVPQAGVEKSGKPIRRGDAATVWRST